MSMPKLSDAELRLMGHEPDVCECDLCCPPNTDPATMRVVYGSCGVEGCTDCRPLFDADNNEIPGT